MDRYKLLISKKEISRISIVILCWLTMTNLHGQDHWVIPDFCEVSEDVSVRVKVLQNDRQDRLDPGTLKILKDGIHGHATVEGEDGLIRYTPVLDFNGLDSFSYQVCTKDGLCQEAIALIRVHPVNDPPIALNDLDTIEEDSWILLDVMQNDGDLADNVMQGEMDPNVFEMPKHGELSVEGKKIIYRPNPNYFGNDYFRYYICDESLCDSAMARIHIKAVNDKPKARNDEYLTYIGLLVVMDVLANDDDSLDLDLPDQASLSTDGLLPPKHGFTYVDAEVGLIVYMPDDQYVGLDSFAYSVCDSGPDPILCDTAMVFLEISDRSGMEAATVQKGLIGNLPFNPETLKNSKTQALPETRRYLLQQLSKQGNLRPGRYSFKLEDDGNILTITPVGTR